MASPQRCARQSRALRIISDQPSDRCGPTPCIPCLLLLGLCRGVKCSGGGRADLTGHLNRTQVLDAAVKPAGCWSKPLDRWRQECTATGTAPPATNLVSGRVWGNDRRDRDPKLFQAAAGLHSSLSAAGVCLASWRADSTAAAPHRRHTSVFWANSPPGTPSGAAGGRAPHLLPWFLSWRGSRCPWNAWGCWRGSEPSRWGISRTSWACPGMACRRRQSPKSPRRLSWSSPRA